MVDLKKIKQKWQESTWLLGICLNGFADLKEGRIHWINNGKYNGRKWFADPFILEYDDNKVSLLVEEFDYKVHRGRIAKLTIDRNSWTVVDCKVILDLETHLSFPMIWRQGVEVLVCPENYHSGGWNMYRYDSKKERLEFICQIIDKKLTDATIWQDGSIFWILSTYEPRPNGSELTIWKSDAINGQFKEFQRVRFSENVSRNAGMIFRYEGKLIRPAQECNHVYGHSLSFQEVEYNDESFNFNEIYRFNSIHPIYDAGAHTFNQYKEMAVIDVKGYRYRHIAKVISSVGSILVKLGIKKPYVIQ